MYTGHQWGHCATQGNGNNDVQVPRRTLGTEKEPLLSLPSGRHSQPVQGPVSSTLNDPTPVPSLRRSVPTRSLHSSLPPLPSLCALLSHRMWIRLPLIQTSWALGSPTPSPGIKKGRCLGHSAANQEEKFQPLAALSVITRLAAEVPLRLGRSAESQQAPERLNQNLGFNKMSR